MPQTTAAIKQVGKFGAVGILNTLIDFSIYNFCLKYLELSTVGSNTISTTIAMLFSFFANRQVVFTGGDGSVRRQAVLFFAVTAFGLYVLQNGVIHLFTDVWRGPLEAVVRGLRSAGIHVFADAFYINNIAKAIGTVVSLTWNFIMYKKVVFK